ncbi:hypothetical protein LJC46_03600 [Desulfovibrio sp. OttesenSCG-928-G15]|nr:hypothetical protein [Desulfovibrio sp. OttesenSCG-928-G15]
MKKSLIPHLLVGAVLLVGAGLWIWLVSSIDYSQLNARSSKSDSAATVEQQVDAAPQGAPAQ